MFVVLTNLSSGVVFFNLLKAKWVSVRSPAVCVAPLCWYAYAYLAVLIALSVHISVYRRYANAIIAMFVATANFAYSNLKSLL